MIIGFVGALVGGLATRYAIYALESKERERRGAMQALLGLHIIDEMLEHTQDNPEQQIDETQFKKYQSIAVEVLLKATALVSKSNRTDLYKIYEQISRLEPTYVSLDTLVQTLKMQSSLKDKLIEEFF